MEITFAFTEPAAMNIAYIIQRNQDNPRLLHDLQVYAAALEKALRKP